MTKDTLTRPGGHKQASPDSSLPVQDRKPETESTHILLELGEGLSDAVLQEDHGLTLGPSLHGCLQGLAHSAGQHGAGGGAMGIAGGEGGLHGRTVHMDGAGME